jgi:hypothetical protein
MRPVTIAVLGRFPDIFNGFVESAEKYLPTIPKVFVRDGNEIVMPTGTEWTCIQGPEVFSNPGNANLAWQAAAPDSDILYCGDDVRFLQYDTWQLLQEIAYSDPKIGALSPKIIGAAGNNLQMYPSTEGITYSHQRLAYICVYIKRETIDKAGYMDEEFGGSYGYDDDSHCLKIQRAGYTLAITSKVSVEHKNAGSTFARTGPGTDCRTGAEKFKAKWGEATVHQIAADVAKDYIVVAQNLPKMQPTERSGRAPQRLRRA